MYRKTLIFNSFFMYYNTNLYIADKFLLYDIEEKARMELSTIACDAILQSIKLKIASKINLNNGQFQNVEHMGRTLVDTFKATHNSVKFLNTDDVALPTDVAIMILQKKITMYSVLEIALTAIEGIGPDMNIEEALQNTATKLMHTINEL